MWDHTLSLSDSALGYMQPLYLSSAPFKPPQEILSGTALVLIMVKILLCERALLCLRTICKQPYVISTRHSPLTPLFLPLSPCAVYHACGST